MVRRTDKYKINEKRFAKKRKIKYKNVLIFFLVLILLFLFVIGFMQLRVTNIYVSNNNYLTDQEIIDIAGLSNYPKSYLVPTFSLKKKLISNKMINSAVVTKKMLTSIYIEVIENRPIFYDSNKQITKLLDGTEASDKYLVPNVVNYIPDTIYNDFFNNMVMVSSDVLDRISEIKYDPNDVDNERFLLFMNDGNYVYLNLDKFQSINSYLDIIKQINGKKGILYLDSGGYFKIL